MSHFFDVNDLNLRYSLLNKTLFDALDHLKEHSLPNWGKMTSQHMVEHLIWSFQISRGNIQVKCIIPKDRLSQLKTFLYNNMQTPHEFRNPVLPEDLLPLQYSSLDAAKIELKAEVERCFLYVKKNPKANHTHPMFGPISTEEWERSHYKHCYHHLLQFGLIKYKNR